MMCYRYFLKNVVARESIDLQEFSALIQGSVQGAVPDSAVRVEPRYFELYVNETLVAKTARLMGMKIGRALIDSPLKRAIKSYGGSTQRFVRTPGYPVISLNFMEGGN